MRSTATAKIIATIKAAIAGADDPTFQLKGPIRTSVLYDDGTYKTKPVEGDEELILTGIREGARGQFILEFKPFEKKPFKQVEISKEAQFDLLPGLEFFLVTALGFRGTGDDIQSHIPLPTWKQAVKQYTATVEADEQIEAEQEAIQAVEHYKDNPMWGMFG